MSLHLKPIEDKLPPRPTFYIIENDQLVRFITSSDAEASAEMVALKKRSPSLDFVLVKRIAEARLTESVVIQREEEGD